MKRLLISALVLASLGACTTPEETAAAVNRACGTEPNRVEWLGKNDLDGVQPRYYRCRQIIMEQAREHNAAILSPIIAISGAAGATPYSGRAVVRTHYPDGSTSKSTVTWN